MGAKVYQDVFGTHATITPDSKGMDFKKYNLTGIEIEAVDNGVIINCRYRLKQEEVAKMAKQKEKGDYPSSIDYDSRYPNEKHVFESMEKAAAFVEARMMGKDYEKSE